LIAEAHSLSGGLGMRENPHPTTTDTKMEIAK
jgi:hypothetical protein